jgi:hypothetical protein
MEWIDREVQFPDADRILCYGGGKIFISELIETKWGNFYSSTEKDDQYWSHWMLLPEPPKGNVDGAD